MEAKESIYISAFILDPEIFLKRPVNEQIYIDMFKRKILTKDFGENMTRLIDILDYKAKNNVKIYILDYYEWGHGVVTSSKHLENVIKKLNNPNIRLIRFPNNAKTKIWTTHEKYIIVDKIIGYIGGIDLSWGKYDSPEHRLYEGPNENNVYEFPLMDYRNQQKIFFSDIENYTKTEISRENDHRFPWHDIQLKIIGPSVKDLVIHFFERWNHANNWEEKLYNETININNVKNLIDKINKKSIWKTFTNLIFDSDKVEKDYIRKRIEKAYENNENFKVFIIIPLFLSIGVDFEDKLSIIRIEPLIKYIYQSISRNNGLSLIEQLEKKMGDKWKNYISFYSLRNHGLVNNVPATERINVHSKLLIVDDTKVIIGSPNLNDRSLLGDRDSEIAILIEEKMEDNFIMDGNKYQASKTAVELRKKLMAEFLGIDLNDPILVDPVNNDLFNCMNSKARINTEIYRTLFQCFPDNLYTSYKILNEALNQNDEWPDVLFNKYMREKDKIQGFIVEFPFDFLKDEKMNNKFVFPDYTYT